jgi:hypothetical protein
MKVGHLVVLFLFVSLVFGGLYFTTQLDQEAARWASINDATVTRVFLVLVVAVSAARGLALIVESRRGTLEAELGESRAGLDFIRRLGAVPATILDGLAAYTLFTAGFSILVADLSGQLSASSPGIPPEGLFLVFFVSVGLVLVALWFLWRTAFNLYRSPGLSKPVSELVAGPPPSGHEGHV